MRRLAAAGVLVLLTSACGSSGEPASTPAPSSRPAGTASSTQIAKTPTQGARSTPVAPPAGGRSAAATAGSVPRFAHIVVVVEENHASAQIIGSPAAPFINSLARSGTLLTRSYGIRHPSYPNYLALFSGSTHGITDDSCPHYYRSNNLAAQLRTTGLSFAGYSQGLPSTGYQGCTYGKYARRHAPWIDFLNVSRTLHKPMRAFPTDFTKLPRVAFVIPDLDHDMHDGTVRQADTWLHNRLAGYVSWARTHNSLLILTWDEDDRLAGNHIPGVIVGAHVKAGRYGSRVDHYRMLRTIEAAYGLRPLGSAADRTPITGIWVP